MALKFYLYSTNTNDNGLEIHCNTNSTITEIAGTFDLGTMELEWNECKYAIFPNTPFIIVDTESNETWNFIINEDNIEVVKKTDTIKYLHRLTLSQSVHKLNNVPVRTSIFSLPFFNEQKINRALSFIGTVKYIYNTDHDYDPSLPRTKKDSIYYAQCETRENSDTFLKNNYSIDFTNASKATSGSLKLSSVLNLYNENTISDNTVVDDLFDKYVNSNIEYLTIEFIDCDYPTEKLSFVHTEHDIDNILGKEIKLSSYDLQWIISHKFYIKLFDTNAKSTLISRFPESNDNKYAAPVTQTGFYYAPLILGMIFIELKINAYSYTLWDVLDTLNKQCKKQYNGSSFDDFYVMPDKTEGQGLELDSIPAPELDFTNLDLYEAVAKTLSFIDAFPILKKETVNGTIYNNVLGFQYLNNLSEDTIDNLEIGDVKTTLNETNFTNKLSTIYQNARLKQPITYPMKDAFRLPTTTKPGVPDKNDWYFVLSKPIDYIDEFKIILTTNSIMLPQIKIIEPTSAYILWDTVRFEETSLNLVGGLSAYAEVSLMPVLYSTNNYARLKVGVAESSVANKYNSLYFERGDNKIYCGETGEIHFTNIEDDVLEYAIKRAIALQYGFGVLPSGNTLDTIGIDYSGSKFDYYYNCTYHPILDGKVAQDSTSNKTEKETIIAQTSGTIELNKLGNNLQGMIARLGNEEKSITLPITKLKDRAKLGTHYIDELGNNWIINRLKTTFTTKEDKVIVEATFTKNFNAMQQFTSLNQEKKLYEIDGKLVSKGYETINEYIYFTTRDDLNVSNLATQIAFYYLGLQAIFDKTFNSVGYGYQIAGYNSIFDNVAFTTEYQNPDNISYIQPIVYGCGNQICFEMSFEEPISAGSYKIVEDSYINTIYQLYTNETGKSNTISLFAKFKDANVRSRIDNYPHIESEGYNSLPGTWIFGVMLFDYYKKPNEIFHLNYSLNFLPYWEKTTDNDLNIPQYIYEEIFFGDSFVNENGIIPNANNETKAFSIWVSENNKFSIIDNVVNNNMATKLTGTITISCITQNKNGTQTTGFASFGSINVLQNGSPINVSQYKSWCIADEENNIYIAVNRNSNSSDYAELKWFTSRNRKT